MRDGNHNRNGHKALGKRLSGYVTEDEKQAWQEYLEEISELEHNPDLGMGRLFSRTLDLVQAGSLRLDQVSVAQALAQADQKYKRHRQTPART